MAFASKFAGMLFFASCVALGGSVLSEGCIATDTIDFVPAENFPPSIISQLNADFPLNKIGEINLDDPVPEGQPAAMPLQVIIRDPNFDQTLDYRIFLDAPDPPAAEFRLQEGEIAPTGFLERPRTFEIAYNDLDPGFCHKIELVVAGKFASNVEQRRPEEPGDFDQVTWWVEVTNADNPIAQACR